MLYVNIFYAIYIIIIIITVHIIVYGHDKRGNVNF